MLYLEDFLELIEPFPQEIRERLTEMREIDLKIQNETDKLDDRLQIFFQQCKKQKTDWKNENYEEIKKEYGKVLENADDKIKIANQLYDLIEKYLKKLDQEIQKFKLELEADNAGITSKLEHAAGISGAGPSNADLLAIMGDPSLAGASGSLLNSFSNCLDDSDFTLCPASNNDPVLMMGNNQNESYYGHQHMATNKRKHSTNLDRSHMSHNLSSALINKNEDEDSGSSWNSRIDNQSTGGTIHRKGSLTTAASISNKKHLTSTGSVSSNLSHSSSMINSVSLASTVMGAANKRLHSSSSAAQQRVKRTKSEKSIHGGNRAANRKSRIMALDEDEEDSFDATEYDQVHSTDDLNDSNDAADSEMTSENDHGPNGGDLSANEDNNLNDDRSSDELEAPHGGANTKLKFGKHNRNPRHFKEDWSSNDDTNERYCICKDVSYGDMIACDNNRCETQWFHFTCVGLNSAPKGKWYCPNCVEIRKKQAEKKPNPVLSSTAPLVRGTSSSGVINPSNLINQYPSYLSPNVIAADSASAPATSPSERKNSGSYTPTFKFTTPSSNMASSHTSTTTNQASSSSSSVLRSNT